ncbi:hypothetical protein EMCRGX_G029113 [Ephydatia muelleri]
MLRSGTMLSPEIIFILNVQPPSHLPLCILETLQPLQGFVICT